MGCFTSQQFALMRFNEQFWDSGQFFSYICAVFLREGAAGRVIGEEAKRSLTY